MKINEKNNHSGINTYQKGKNDIVFSNTILGAGVDWINVQGTQSDDMINVKTSTKAISFNSVNNTPSKAYKTNTIDMTNKNFIKIRYYVDNIANIASDNLIIQFYTNTAMTAGYQSTLYLYKLLTQNWYEEVVPRAMFSNIGTPTGWNNVVRMAVRVISKASTTLNVTVDEVSFFESPNSKAKLFITCDDVYVSQYTKLLPAMQSRGYTATCFIPSAQVGTAGKLTWDNIREIERAGWTIGNHTRNHSNFGTETLVNIEADIKNGKSDLIANGLNPKNAEIFAFPASTVPYIERTASIVSENCIFARTTSAYPQSGILSSPINPIMSAPCYGAGTGVTPAQFDARLVKTIADKSSMILLIHDIGGIGSAVQWTDQELADFFVIIDAYVGAGSLDVVCLGNEFRKLNISLEV